MPATTTREATRPTLATRRRFTRGRSRARARPRRGLRAPALDAPACRPSATARDTHLSLRAPEPSPACRSPAGTTPEAGASARSRRRRTPLRATARPASRGPGSGPLPVLDELEAEAALDAEVAARDVVVVRRGDLDDRVVLDVQREVAAHAAVRAHGVDLRLLLRLPLARLSKLVLVRRHQRAGRADGDAVAAVDTGRLRQRHIELRGDVRVEAAAGDCDRKRVLVLLAARLDALVTEDALRVVAHVELVVELRRLCDRCASGTETLRVRVVTLDVAQRLRCSREIDRRAEQLHDEPAARLHAWRIRLDGHSLLDLSRAGGDKGARAFQLDDADAADVHRVERVAVAKRRCVDPEPAARIEDRRALGHAHRAAVDGQLDELLRGGDGDHGHGASTPRFIIADATALAAVWPRPQIEASRMTCVRSASTSSSLPFARPLERRCRASSWRTVPTRHGTHWPHDSSRKNSAIRRTASTRSALSS